MDGPKSKTTRTKAAAADGFPDDLVVEILSRLHAKPLFRFKCVSKRWRRLIADRLGRRMNNSPQTHTLEGFFVGGGGAGGGVNDSRFINLSGKPAPLVDASFSFLPKLPGIGRRIKQTNLLSAHNGLLLFARFLDLDRYEYLVCNPATEQWMRVPGPGFTPPPPGEFAGDVSDEVRSLLIFDRAVSSHFHLLQFRHHRGFGRTVLVFSSEAGVWRDSTMEWRERGESPAVEFVVAPSSKLGCADVHGFLHVAVYRYHHSGTKDVQIAVVDMKGEKIMAMQWPGIMNKSATAAAFVGQSQGCLHCITAHRKQEGHLVHITGLSIWVLEDYDAGRWVLKQTVNCSQLFGETFCGVDDLDVITIHPDRSLIFFVHRCSWKLMSYDMDSEEVCDLCTLGHGCGLVIPYVPYFADVPVLSGRASTGFLEGQPTIV